MPPFSDCEANLVKSLGNIVGSIPIPISFIETKTKNLSAPFFRSAEITMLPCSSVNLIALLRRLERTCEILPLSPSMLKFSLTKDDIFM